MGETDGGASNELLRPLQSVSFHLLGPASHEWPVVRFLVMSPPSPGSSMIRPRRPAASVSEIGPRSRHGHASTWFAQYHAMGFWDVGGDQSKGSPVHLIIVNRRAQRGQ